MLNLLLVLLGLYLLAGMAFAVVFHLWGLHRVDPAVAGAGWFFRLLVSFGLVGLWPVMASKWRRTVRGENPAGGVEQPLLPRGLRSFHRWLVLVVMVLVAALAGAALTLRPPALEHLQSPPPPGLEEGS